MLQEPPPPSEIGLGGAMIETLKRRLSGIAAERITDLAIQLTDELRLVTIGPNLNVTMSPSGAVDLRSHFTRYGKRFVAYLRSSEAAGS